MWTRFWVVLGKFVSSIVRLRSTGSAFPGRIVELFDRNFLKNILAQLPLGVAIITGTNGKTTTTKIVTALLEAHDLKVFTNPSGSNMTRGIISSLLRRVQWNGKLDYDMAVLELDEAYSIQFSRQVAPDYALVLNLFRDQLDRYGEIDSTAKKLEEMISRVKTGLVLNREDPYVMRLNQSAQIEAVYFGLISRIRLLIKNDDELYSSSDLSFEYSPYAKCDLTDYRKGEIQFNYLGENLRSKFQLIGIHNALNAVAGWSLASEILGDRFRLDLSLNALAKIKPAFGRGEIVHIQGVEVEIMLVKNPSGFRYALQDDQSPQAQRMIVINDAFADGRDVSWLWDVDFRPLIQVGVNIVSGVRAFDMAIRLLYDDVPIQRVIPEIATALNYALNNRTTLRIYCTYTAMLAVRRGLAKLIKLQAIEV
ncbi:MAG: MurT ligase domain-containing protein [Bifidobacteriaceae bacterium]|jgi:UDP-N-acetylmuramyl tripeptide synthase|nr:MurT ligase domain-containing protein [Bifidobacteriaceae bacterium]